MRASIGVVPQETTLFNSELGYNIQYGGVTGEELPSTQVPPDPTLRPAPRIPEPGKRISAECDQRWD